MSPSYQSNPRAEIEQLQSLIRTAIPAFSAPDADEASVLQFLLNQHTDPLLARQVVTFAPLAFGRAILAQLPIVFSTTYSTIDDQDNFTEGNLLELESVFIAAQWLADELIEQRQWSEAQHMPLATWSAELKAVNSLLHSGSKPENIELLPPVIKLEMVSPAPHAKPWWKFW